MKVKLNFWGRHFFLRAYYHFDLASMYGNVPLVIVPSGELVTQGEVSTLYGQMLQDLRDAIEMMPAVRNTDGHVDKYTAEALLARIFLFIQVCMGMVRHWLTLPTLLIIRCLLLHCPTGLR